MTDDSHLSQDERDTRRHLIGQGLDAVHALLALANDAPPVRRERMGTIAEDLLDVLAALNSRDRQLRVRDALRQNARRP